MQMLYNFLYLLPKNILSELVGKLVAYKWPQPLQQFFVKTFAAHYKINLDEAEFPIAHYNSIAELFTRKLKPCLRPISGEIIHPVDGDLTQSQIIEYPVLIQAKGLHYSIDEFLHMPNASTIYKKGIALTYYLCPTDYHRVHSPVSGEIVQVTHVPGQLWPVNIWSVNNIKELFVKNERVIMHIQTPRGLVMYVMVGATNVGKMTLAFDDDIITNQPTARALKTKKYVPAIPIKVGDELGTFNMGSTVIVFYEPNFLPQLPKLGKVKLGEIAVE